MICKIVTRLSQNKFRVESTTGKFNFTATNSLANIPSIGEYVVVTDSCIVGKTTNQTAKETFRV